MPPVRCGDCLHFRPVERGIGGRCRLGESVGSRSNWYWSHDDFCSRFEPRRTLVETTDGPMSMDWSRLKGFEVK